MEIVVNITGGIDLAERIGAGLVQVGEDDYEEQVETLADRVVLQLVRELKRDSSWPTLVDRMKTIRDEEIRAAIRPSVEEAVRAPIQKTNGYGAPIGEPTTLAELVIAEARAVLNGAERESFGHRQSLVQKVVREEVAAALQKELVAEVKAAREKVVAAVKTHAADAIATAVRDGLAARR